MEPSSMAPEGLEIRKHQESDRVIALCCNPNVGKSTIFNALTGLRQHTCYLIDGKNPPCLSKSGS